MIPVLWLTGPPGVGKTAVAWEIYRRLQSAADPAYVDVDQLGICYPPAAEDRDRHALKARNVAALRANFAAAGARALVVSGVVDAERGPGTGALGGLSIVAVRLRADRETLRDRLHRREGPSPQHAATLEEAEAFDRGAFADRCVDTSQLSIDEAATRVLAELGDWPRGGRAEAPPPAADGANHRPDGEVLWVSGPAGVGKSTVGFRAYLEVLGAGIRAAYVDAGQVGFCSTAPEDHALRARNLAALWRNFHAAGAQRAVVTGRIATRSQARAYEQALPGVTWYRLQAGDAELTRRILSRGEGGSWSEPGDPLRGRPQEALLDVAGRAIADGSRLDQSDLGLRIDTDGLDVEAAAQTLLARARWPGAPQAED